MSDSARKKWRSSPRTRENGPSKAKSRKQRPIEQKESLRWLETHQHAQEIARQYPETKIVAVADSEADIFEVIETDQNSPEAFQWIIRGCYDRATIEDDDPESVLLREKLIRSEVRYRKTIAIRGREKKLDCDKRARNQPRKSRQCDVEVRAESARSITRCVP